MRKIVTCLVLLAILAIFPPTLFAADAVEGEWLKDDQSARIKLKVTRKGELIRTLEIDGDEAPLDEEGKALVAELITDFFRLSGYAAEERVARIYGEGGFDAVMEEMGHLEKGHVSRKYYSALYQVADELYVNERYQIDQK